MTWITAFTVKAFKYGGMGGGANSAHAACGCRERDRAIDRIHRNHEPVLRTLDSRPHNNAAKPNNPSCKY